MFTVTRVRAALIALLLAGCATQTPQRDFTSTDTTHTGYKSVPQPDPDFWSIAGGLILFGQIISAVVP
jgi:hypothetical protein